MEANNESANSGTPVADIRDIVRGAIEEFVRMEQAKSEPAYKQELIEERKRREQLERRVNELADENRKNRQIAEEVERNSAIRTELQRLGVAKVDLAFKAVKDEIQRTQDGALIARTDTGEVPMRAYLSQFVSENPELLPSRISGGSGAGPGHVQSAAPAQGIDLDKVRPGMSAEELEKVRKEIARVARQTIRGM